MEKAENTLQMMEPLIVMAQEAVKDIEPNNVVAKFVEENFPTLVELETDAPLIDMSSGIITAMMVNQANENVEYSLKALLKFYESFRIFYKELLEASNKKEEPKEDTEEEPEPPTWIGEEEPSEEPEEEVGDDYREPGEEPPLEEEQAEHDQD